jgi:hypothetical protein
LHRVGGFSDVDFSSLSKVHLCVPDKLRDFRKGEHSLIIGKALFMPVENVASLLKYLHIEFRKRA